MSTWDNQIKSGNDWEYNEQNLAYNDLYDPDGNAIIYYNSAGSSPTYTNVTKH
jgi:hypothetical protein